MRQCLTCPASLIAIAATVAAALAGAAPGQGPPPAAVQVQAARRETVQERRMVTGELRALRRSQVATQEPGLVMELPVREGQRVKAGDVVARLDSRRLELEQKQLQGDLDAARNLIEERQATLAWKQRDLELIESSFDRGGANPRELRDAESAFRVAEAQARWAERQLEITQARLDLVARRIADTAIEAPFDGVIVVRRAELGEWVDEGEPVAEIVSTGAIEAWLDVPQLQFGAVAAGCSELAVVLNAGSEVIAIQGVRVVPQVDPTARSFHAVATLDDGGRLAPGMSVTAWLPTGQTTEMLTVPRDSILRNEVGAYVYVARSMAAEGPAVAIVARVRVLFPHGDRWVIESGELRDGEPVVVEGNERLYPMAAVVPQAAGFGEGGGSGADGGRR